MNPPENDVAPSIFGGNAHFPEGSMKPLTIVRPEYPPNFVSNVASLTTPTRASPSANGSASSNAEAIAIRPARSM